MYCVDKDINYSVSYLPIPKHSPATEFFSRDLFLKPMKNLDYTEMIMDSAFWPHNPQLLKEMTSVTMISWSPEGVTRNNEHVLAVLTNIGNIELFGPHISYYESLFNLSKAIKVYVSKGMETPKTIEALKTAVKAIQTISFCWGPKLFNSSFYFVTAQRNGNILIWLIHFKQEVKAELRGVIETDEEIHTVMWLHKCDDSFLLICSNVSGQINVYDCQNAENLLVTNTACLWTYKDRMVAKHIVHTVIDNKIALVFSKHRHLIILLLDKNYNILSQVARNVNDKRITNIRKGKHCVYLSTVNSQIFKITFSIMSTDLNINVHAIELNQYRNCELYSFDKSINEAWWVLGFFNRQVSHRKDIDKLDIIFFHNTEQNDIELLLNNPTNKLTNVWDHLQILRCKVIKQRIMPEVNFVELYKSGNVNVYKHKLYLLLLTLYLNLKKFSRNIIKGSLPETSIEVIKEEILLAHAKNVINEYYNSYQHSNCTLDPLKLKWFVGAKNFIEYYCTKNRKYVSDLVDTNIWNLTKVEMRYKCQCCDEFIQGLWCSHRHLNMFCMITFTPIESNDYLYCSNCNSTARIELYENNPMCVFCDLYLVKN
ncbi:uncharacterized protein LOC113226013 [Hyposmocoma kahamanoa]|uniref:uncharacterized protein LOC113226013 n=1 Tax=Hyposmocoma kahamanoa TaxID=1477025 RepID=UPI000E6D6B06|nr:uncharacterized protein LOC113226013 [Hyposmocoma kahamanoa]